MAGLSPLNSDQLLNYQSVQFAAQSKTPIADNKGTPLGDIWFAQKELALFLDVNVQYTNSKARLLTSTGVDVDSFINQFSIFRSPSVFASGALQFTPNSASPVDVVIPTGALCQTSTGLQFQALADSTKTAYQADGYHITAGSVAPIQLLVGCLTAGTVGNVNANTIISSASGLGTVGFGSGTITNTTSFINGSNGETDQAFIQRFILTISSGRWGTNLAVQAAIQSAGTGLTFQIGENVTQTNVTQYGYFTVFVNQIGQSGGATASVIASVKAAIAPIKACGIGYTVVSPTIQTVPAAALFVLDPNYLLQPGVTVATILTAAANAYASYTNNIGLSIANASTLLSYPKVSSVLVTVPGVLNITNFSLNGSTIDVTAPYGTQIVAGTTTFTQHP